MNEELMNLLKLQKRLGQHVDKILANLDDFNTEPRKYDIVIAIEGDQFNLEFNADLADNLLRFIQQQIEDTSQLIN